MKKFVTFGETMVQHNAQYQGDYDRNGPHLDDVAGAESNVAVNLGRLVPDKIEPVWISRLADDDAGRSIQRELEGKILFHAPLFAGEFTGVSFLNHYEDRHIKTYQRRGSAASRLSFEDVMPHLPGADLLHVTGITAALSDTCSATVTAALDWASLNDVPVCFDVNYREPLWSPEKARAAFEVMLGKATVFKVGHDEAETVWALGISADEYARHFFRGRVRLSIVTREADGAVAFDGENLIEHPGYEVNVVDPVGAGDAFVAGFLGILLQRHTMNEFLSLAASERIGPLGEALDVANVCGALTCAAHGDTAAMPTMGQVVEYLERSGRKSRVA